MKKKNALFYLLKYGSYILFNFLLIVILFIVIFKYKLFSIFSVFISVLEIYGTLIIILAELEATSFFKKWFNPAIPKLNAPFTQTNYYLEKDGIKYPYYIGIGGILKKIIYDVDEFLNIYGHIKNAWFWLRNEVNEENCKINLEVIRINDGTIKDLQRQIDVLTKHSETKIFGYLILFSAFSVQLIYSFVNL